MKKNRDSVFWNFFLSLYPGGGGGGGLQTQVLSYDEPDLYVVGENPAIKSQRNIMFVGPSGTH